MSKEKFLNAYNNKFNEFYTLYDDISNEIPKYKSQLKGKRIICPCDWDESCEEEIVYSDGEFIPADDLFSSGDTIKNIDIKKLYLKLKKI